VKLIFLDIDRVLNSGDYNRVAESTTINPAKVDILNNILVETGAHIVITSAWRYMVLGRSMTLVGMEYLLRTHGVIAHRLFSVTESDEETPGFRPELNDIQDVALRRSVQIKRYLLRPKQPVTGYVVIDDLALPELNGHLVQVLDPAGITKDDATKAMRILESRQWRTVEVVLPEKYQGDLA